MKSILTGLFAASMLTVSPIAISTSAMATHDTDCNEAYNHDGTLKDKWQNLGEGGEPVTTELYTRGYSANQIQDNEFTKGQYTTITIVDTAASGYLNPGGQTPGNCPGSSGSMVCTVTGPGGSQGEPEGGSLGTYLTEVVGCTSIVWN